MSDELSLEEQAMLERLTAEWGLPPEATEHVRGTFAFQASLLSHRMRTLAREAMTSFGLKHRN